MKIKTLLLAIATIVSVSLFASANQKIISFQPVIAASERTKSIESLGGKVTREFHIIDALVAVFPNKITDANIYSLQGVTNVEKDKYIKWIELAPMALPLSLVETVLQQIKAGNHEISEASPMSVAPKMTDEEKEIPWGVKRVNASAAWPVTMGEGAKVAVIDTGIDYNHPDLKENYSGGYNVIISSSPPLDDHGHGTHVAGTIAAVRDFKGVVGVAPKAKIYGVKVLDNYGSGYVSWVITGIEWAADNKMNTL